MPRPSAYVLPTQAQEWVAYELVTGASPADLVPTLVQDGLSQALAESLVFDIARNPILSVARRFAREKKKLADINDVLLDLDGREASRRHIAVETDISPSVFHERYYSTNRPVVLRGIVDHWQAFKKWNLDFLRQEFGNILVQYQYRSDPDNHLQAFFDNPRRGSLSYYLDLIQADSLEARKYYLISHDKLLRRIAFRGLLNDISCAPGGILDESAKAFSTHLWLGPSGAVTPMHRDRNNVYLAQVLGRKKVVLVSPLATDRIYNSNGHHSDIDFLAPNYTKYDRAESLYRFEVIIAPGDMLFIPVGWWHHVNSLDVTLSVSGTNFVFQNEFPQLTDYFK